MQDATVVCIPLCSSAIYRHTDCYANPCARVLRILGVLARLLGHYNETMYSYQNGTAAWYTFYSFSLEFCGFHLLMLALGRTVFELLFFKLNIG